jgi:Uma2 family endonuclease
MNAIAQTIERPCTLEEFLALPESNLPHEYIDGTLIMSPSPAWNHQDVVWELSSMAKNFCKETGLALCAIAPLDVKLDSQTIVQPDVLMILVENQSKVKDRIYGPPDWVAEVLSPGNRDYDLVKKRAIYEAAGVPEYWAVDIEAREVLVFRLKDAGQYAAPEVFGAGQTLTCQSVPGFVVAVSDLFVSLP